MSDNCIVIDWYEPPSVFREELRRARKQHVCGECGDPIEPGDLYEHATGCWDGWWSTFKTCARCVNVRNDYFQGWTYEHMAEDFFDHHGFDYREGIPEDFPPCGKSRGSVPA